MLLLSRAHMLPGRDCHRPCSQAAGAVLAHNPHPVVSAAAASAGNLRCLTAARATGSSGARAVSTSATGSSSTPGRSTGHPAGHASAAVPVVDIASLLDGSTASSHQRTACLARLRDTAHTAGFLFVTGHGIPQRLLSDAANAARRLFALPEAAKAAADYHSSAAFRGYMHLGVENTAGRVDEREQFEYGCEGPALPEDGDATAVQPPHFRLHAPNQWPPEQADGSVASIRAVLMAYLEAMHGLAVLMLEALAESMELPRDAFLSFEGSAQGAEAGSERPGSSRATTGAYTSSSTASSRRRARMPPYMTVKALRYPPTANGAGIHESLGVGAHSDSGLITLLLQDEVGGLQAQLPGNSSWVDVVPLPGTLVVNLGELLQLASGGYLVATVHRVVSRPNQKDRISLPFFYNAPLDAVVSPLQLPAELPWQRPPPALQSSTHGGRNQLIATAGENVMKSFARSHPQVLKQHHPDLWAQQQQARH